MPEPTLALIIKAYGPNDFDIHHAGIVRDHLTWDEMLGAVAEITHPKIGASRYPGRLEGEPSRWSREEPEAAPAPSGEMP